MLAACLPSHTSFSFCFLGLPGVTATFPPSVLSLRREGRGKETNTDPAFLVAECWVKGFLYFLLRVELPRCSSCFLFLPGSCTGYQIPTVIVIFIWPRVEVGCWGWEFQDNFRRVSSILSRSRLGVMELVL